jgi:hypothetical protein
MTDTPEMVDRAAKALHAHLIAADGPWSLAQGDYDAVTLDGTFDLRDLARVVIEAMEPTARGLVEKDQRTSQAPIEIAAKRAYEAAIKSGRHGGGEFETWEKAGEINHTYFRTIAAAVMGWRG